MAMMNSDLVTEQSLPSLILMDVQLPGIDGLTLIQALRQHPLWQSVPIVAVTAMAMPGDRDRGLVAGADDYITKPIDLDLLLQKTRQLTQGASRS